MYWNESDGKVHEYKLNVCGHYGVPCNGTSINSTACWQVITNNFTDSPSYSLGQYDQQTLR